VPSADTNSVTQFYGGLYHNAWDALLWATRDTTGNQVKLITYFVSANTWNVMSIGTGGTYLNTTNLGTPPFTKRTGSLIATPSLTPLTGGNVTKDIFVWTTIGLLKGSLTGNLAGFTTVAWSLFNKRQPSATPIFSSVPMHTYSPSLASSRCDLSIQIGSFAEKTLPTFGAGLSATVGGLNWFETGTKVKQITSTIWVGLNRGGYLWIGNPAFSSYPQELYPTGSLTVRGDIAVANFGYTDDYDWEFNGSKSQIALVYKDLNYTNRLGFILYDIGTNAIVVHERGAFSGVVPIGGTPQITYNSVDNTWSIVAQDATVPPTNAKIMYYKRTVGGVAPAAWVVEESALASGSGKNPAKPIHHTDGSVVVITESGASFNFLVSKRDYTTGVWSPIYISSGGGFKSPKLTKTLDNSMWWVFGGVDSTAQIAWTTNPLSGWSIWGGSPTLTNLAYSRVSAPTLLPLTSSVVVASAATVDGAVPANRELLIWRFENSGTARLIGAFTPKGRLQSAIYSGEEEDGITDLSWTPDQKLLYGAIRPTRTTLHWSLRGSTNSWASPHGDSLLGSGRYITLGAKHFREQWGSALATGGGTVGQDLITEYTSLTSGSVLPLAIRTGETDFTSIKWPYTTSSGYLFTTGSSVSGTDDTGAATGTLIASASRGWPLILGNTRWGGLSHTGAAVFSQGAMLGLYPPTGSTNLAYFGNATIGSSNLFKVKALAAVTFNGTKTWVVSPTKQYTLVGPVTYVIDTSLAALGSHLVLEFNTSSSLTMDAAETPLSYWQAIDHSSTKYAVVVGEAREQSLLLYPALGMRSSALPLTYGHLEPIEMTTSVSEWSYSAPYRLDVVPAYEIATISAIGVGGSYSAAYTGSGLFYGMDVITNLERIGQTFTTPSVATNITNVQVAFYNVGSLESNSVYVDIWNVSSITGKPTTLIGTSNPIPKNTFPAAYGSFTTFTFPSVISLDPLTKYAWTIRITGSFSVSLRSLSEDPASYTGGNQTQSSDAGVTWYLYTTADVSKWAVNLAGVQYTTISFKEIGSSLRGNQASTFSLSRQQIAMRRLLPSEGCFLFQTNNAITSSSKTNTLATLTSSVVTIDKLYGEMP
jgi:hypothetical protein